MFIDLITLCCNKLKEKKEFKKTVTIRKESKTEGLKEAEQYGKIIRKKIQEENDKNEQFIEYNDRNTVHV